MYAFNYAVSALTGLAVTALLGFIFIPALRRLKFGQTILDIGPAWHKNKAGTPTMGGIMFIIGTFAAYGAGIFLLSRARSDEAALFRDMRMLEAMSGFLLAVFIGFIGFLDDFIKVKLKRNEGLTVNQKLFLQVFVIAAYFTVRIMSGDTRTGIVLPFIGSIDLSYFYYVIVGLGIIYIVNAVNFTDGVDGLCSTVTIAYCVAFFIICERLRYYEFAVLTVAVAGSLIGFLIWNFHPAKVFMGDTGSMFLGGVVCAVGIGTHCEIAMIIASGVYIWEALTVVIQMVYFKATKGKRLFKMTPIHHGFEMRGWKETKINVLFFGIAAICGGLAVASIIFGT